MAYRFTNTDKWSDAWFLNLKPMEKLLFYYLCDNCDIAGFIELNIRKWAFDIGTTTAIIEGALKGLPRGIIIGEECIFIKNFLKHQKNLPLNPERNPAHRGIIQKFENYKERFGVQDFNELLNMKNEGATKPLPRGLGNGIGNGIGKKGDYKGENLDERREKFFSEVGKYQDKYPVEMLNAFYSYWTEADGKGKMRYEYQKIFEISKRLATWYYRTKIK